jgi:hypothetical protein
MVVAMLSRWFVVLALGQAPGEPDWLKLVPADVDMAIRIQGVDGTHNDLIAMLKAMNPEWAKMADEALASPLAQFREHHGERALKTPWVTVLRLGQADAEGGVAFAALVPSESYPGVLKELSGVKDLELKHEDGGVDAFEGPGGQKNWYAAKGPGIVAFGPAKELVAAVAKPGAKTLDTVLKGAAARPFLSGDVGAYVNAAALTTRFADQIEQGRQTLMAVMDQAGQQAGNEASIKFIKDFYGGLFDSLKYADALTLDVDLAETGLHLAGVLNVKPDSGLARSIPTIHTSDAAGLGRFAPDAMAYIYMNLGSKMFHQFQSMSLNMLNPGGKSTPAFDKAMAELEALERVESLGAVKMTGGIRGMNDIVVSDPRKYVDANLALVESFKGGEGPLNVYKDVKVERNAKTYEGMTFAHVVMSIDLDRLAKLGGNVPGQAENMKAMFGGESMSFWYGTDGKRLLQVMASSWDEARAQLDAYLKGDGGIGGSAGFKAVRAQLPPQASLLAMLSAQNFARMFATQLATMTKNPNVKPPADLPKDPALVGFSLTPRPPAGIEFHLVVPASVGSVIDKGIVPMFRQLQAGAPNL